MVRTVPYWEYVLAAGVVKQETIPAGSPKNSRCTVRTEVYRHTRLTGILQLTSVPLRPS